MAGGTMRVICLEEVDGLDTERIEYGVVLYMLERWDAYRGWMDPCPDRKGVQGGWIAGIPPGVDNSGLQTPTPVCLSCNLPTPCIDELTPPSLCPDSCPAWYWQPGLPVCTVLLCPGSSPAAH